MSSLLLFFALFFYGGQTAAQPQPLVDNERVVVWRLSSPAAAQPMDAVVVEADGHTTFVPEGTAPQFTGEAVVIGLKDQPVAALENTSGYPIAFPRPGIVKLLENTRVTAWDYTWTKDAVIPMHFHDKDVVAVYFGDGDIKTTTLEGQIGLIEIKPGMVRYNARGRLHNETLIRGVERAVIVELK